MALRDVIGSGNREWGTEPRHAPGGSLESISLCSTTINRALPAAFCCCNFIVGRRGGEQHTHTRSIPLLLFAYPVPPPCTPPPPDTGDVDGAPSHRSTTAASITRATFSGSTLLLRPPASRFLLHPIIRTHARICCTPARSSPRRRQRPPQFLLSNTFEDSRSAGSFDRESQDHTTASTSPHFARFCLIPLLRI